LLSGALLLVFFALLYGAVPDRLPLLIQRLVGLTSALLVMLFVTLSLGEIGRRNKNFGIAAAKYTGLINGAGWVVFVLVLAWWFTRLAPIQPY
jgi:amino acid transporter